MLLTDHNSYSVPKFDLQLKSSCPQILVVATNSETSLLYKH